MGGATHPAGRHRHSGAWIHHPSVCRMQDRAALCLWHLFADCSERIIRKAALHGLWDYDIENCHFAIFSQLAAKYGYQADAVRDYINRKNDIREGIASRVGIRTEQAKMAFAGPDVWRKDYRSARERHQSRDRTSQCAGAIPRCRVRSHC